MIVTQAQPQPEPQPMGNAAAPDPLREAALALHEQFLSEMLKQAKLGEALGTPQEAQTLGASLSHLALGQIAGDIAQTQPAFTDNLYQALRRAAPSPT